MRIGRQAFPHWSESGYNFFISRLKGSAQLSYTTTPDGKVVGFRVFEYAYLNGDINDPTVLYTAYSGVDKEVEGNGINEKSFIPIIDFEQPDVIAGCTGNPAIYVANQRIAEEKGYDYYPVSDSVPYNIFQLGRDILTQFSSEDASERLGPNLVKENSDVTARGNSPFQYFEQVLKLQPTQQVLYMMVKNDLVY